MKKPVPQDVESNFEFDEFFFSTTDLRGVIQSCNDVFVRVSKYPKENLIAAPHSVIRHPDMPRAVFKLLWSTIQSGQPIVAYVKNMAADGSYYWVQAFVFPLKESYLSIRIKPSSALFDAALTLYPLTLNVEKEQSMDDSLPFLLEQIKAAGFANYREFMVKAALSELAIIHEKLPESTEHGNQRAQEISEISRAAAKELKICAQHIDAFQVGNQSFIQIMSKLNDAFVNLKYIALNMTVSAAKYGEKVSSLGVVAKEFSNLSGQIQDHLSGLTRFIDTLKELSTQCALRIVSLEVQMLMVVFFINESIAKMKHSEDAFSEMNAHRHQFSDLFSEYALALKSEMQNLRMQTQSVSSEMAEIRKFITGLEVIAQIGAVESSRENEVKQTFAHYLDEMRRFISLLQTSTTSIQREILEMDNRSETIMATAHNLSGKVHSIFELAANVDAES